MSSCISNYSLYRVPLKTSPWLIRLVLNWACPWECWRRCSLQTTSPARSQNNRVFIKYVGPIKIGKPYGYRSRSRLSLLLYVSEVRPALTVFHGNMTMQTLLLGDTAYLGSPPVTVNQIWNRVQIVKNNWIANVNIPKNQLFPIHAQDVFL